MKTVWVLVADASRARILEITGGDVQELDAFAHPESRLPARELTGDLPGRVFDSHGEGRHAIGAESGTKEQEAKQFAVELGAFLDDARKRHRFDRLIVAAPPRFLGVLRAGLSTPTGRAVNAFVAKALTRETPARIHTLLSEYL